MLNTQTSGGVVPYLSFWHYFEKVIRKITFLCDCFLHHFRHDIHSILCSIVQYYSMLNWKSRALSYTKKAEKPLCVSVCVGRGGGFLRIVIIMYVSVFHIKATQDEEISNNYYKSFSESRRNNLLSRLYCHWWHSHEIRPLVRVDYYFVPNNLFTLRPTHTINLLIY